MELITLAKLTGEELLELPPVQVYKMVLDSVIGRFPNRFWVGEEALARSSEITVYLIEGVLKWGSEDVQKQLGIKTFNDNKLLGMLNSIFKGSSYAALENAYPGKYQAYELANVPVNYWNTETQAAISNWIATHGAGMNAQVTRKLFRSSQSGMNK